MRRPGDSARLPTPSGSPPSVANAVHHTPPAQDASDRDTAAARAGAAAPPALWAARFGTTSSPVWPTSSQPATGTALDEEVRQTNAVSAAAASALTGEIPADDPWGGGGGGDPDAHSEAGTDRGDSNSDGSLDSDGDETSALIPARSILGHFGKQRVNVSDQLQSLVVTNLRKLGAFVFQCSKWLPPRYELRFLLNDVLGGVVMSVMLLPMGLAYAKLMRIAPLTGVYSAAWYSGMYAIVGATAKLSMGPAAETTLMLMDAPSLPLDDNERVRRYALITLQVGIFTFIYVAFRGGNIIRNTLSRTVAKAYATAAGLLLLLTQVRSIFNLPGRSTVVAWDTIYVAFESCVSYCAPSSLYSALWFGIFLSYLLFVPQLKFIPTWVPHHIIVVILSITLTSVFGLHNHEGINIIANIPVSPINIGLPQFTWNEFVSVLPFSALFAVVSFLQMYGIAANLNPEIDANQELFSQGACASLTSLLGGFAGCSSFSRCLVLDRLGVHTPLFSLIASVLLIFYIEVLVKAGFFYYMPSVVLTAIICAAVYKLVDFSAPMMLWNVAKADFAVWVVTFVGVTCLGVTVGISAGIALSVLIVLMRVSTPDGSIVAFDARSGGYRSTEGDNELLVMPQVLCWEYPHPLFFINVNSLRTLLESVIDREHRPIDYVILDLTHSSGTDVSAAETFNTQIESLQRSKNVELYVVLPFISEVRQLLTALPSKLTFRMFESVPAAVAHASELIKSSLPPAQRRVPRAVFETELADPTKLSNALVSPARTSPSDCRVLCGVVGLVSHGYRTPKQKLKSEFDDVDLAEQLFGTNIDPPAAPPLPSGANANANATTGTGNASVSEVIIRDFNDARLQTIQDALQAAYATASVARRNRRLQNNGGGTGGTGGTVGSIVDPKFSRRAAAAGAAAAAPSTFQQHDDADLVGTFSGTLGSMTTGSMSVSSVRPPPGAAKSTPTPPPLSATAAAVLKFEAEQKLLLAKVSSLAFSSFSTQGTFEIKVRGAGYDARARRFSKVVVTVKWGGNLTALGYEHSRAMGLGLPNRLDLPLAVNDWCVLRQRFEHRLAEEQMVPPDAIPIANGANTASLVAAAIAAADAAAAAEAASGLSLPGAFAAITGRRSSTTPPALVPAPAPPATVNHSTSSGSGHGTTATTVSAAGAGNWQREMRPVAAQRSPTPPLPPAVAATAQRPSVEGVRREPSDTGNPPGVPLFPSSPSLGGAVADFAPSNDPTPAPLTDDSLFVPGFTPAGLSQGSRSTPADAAAAAQASASVGHFHALQQLAASAAAGGIGTGCSVGSASDLNDWIGSFPNAVFRVSCETGSEYRIVDTCNAVTSALMEKLRGDDAASFAHAPGNAETGAAVSVPSDSGAAPASSGAAASDGSNGRHGAGQKRAASGGKARPSGAARNATPSSPGGSGTSGDEDEAARVTLPFRVKVDDTLLLDLPKHAERVIDQNLADFEALLHREEGVALLRHITGMHSIIRHHRSPYNLVRLVVELTRHFLRDIERAIVDPTKNTRQMLHNHETVPMLVMRYRIILLQLVSSGAESLPPSSRVAMAAIAQQLEERRRERMAAAAAAAVQQQQPQQAQAVPAARLAQAMSFPGSVAEFDAAFSSSALPGSPNARAMPPPLVASSAHPESPSTALPPGLRTETAPRPSDPFAQHMASNANRTFGGDYSREKRLFKAECLKHLYDNAAYDAAHNFAALRDLSAVNLQVLTGLLGRLYRSLTAGMFGFNDSEKRMTSALAVAPVWRKIQHEIRQMVAEFGRDPALLTFPLKLMFCASVQTAAFRNTMAYTHGSGPRTTDAAAVNRGGELELSEMAERGWHFMAHFVFRVFRVFTCDGPASGGGSQNPPAAATAPPPPPDAGAGASPLVPLQFSASGVLPASISADAARAVTTPGSVVVAPTRARLRGSFAGKPAQRGARGVTPLTPGTGGALAPVRAHTFGGGGGGGARTPGVPPTGGAHWMAGAAASAGPGSTGGDLFADFGPQVSVAAGADNANNSDADEVGDDDDDDDDDDALTWNASLGATTSDWASIEESVQQKLRQRIARAQEKQEKQQQQQRRQPGQPLPKLTRKTSKGMLRQTSITAATAGAAAAAAAAAASAAAASALTGAGAHSSTTRRPMYEVEVMASSGVPLAGSWVARTPASPSSIMRGGSVIGPLVRVAVFSSADLDEFVREVERQAELGSVAFAAKK
jgi:SulP family sulfate permease